MSSGLEAQAGFQKEAGYTCASVFVPQQLTTVLPSRAGPYTSKAVDMIRGHSMQTTSESQTPAGDQCRPKRLRMSPSLPRE